MSDTKYNSQKELLKKNYGTALSELGASKKQSQEMAAITLDKLKKYLPYQLKAQGIAGTGASESTMLQAHNNYMNTMGDIARNYNTEKAALDTSHNAEMSALEKEENIANYNLYSDLVHTKLENYIQDDDGDGKLSSGEKGEIESYIGGLTGITDQDRNRLLKSLDAYQVRNDDEQKEITQTTAKEVNKANIVQLEGDFSTANNSDGDNFEVSVGENVYKVERGKTILPDSDTDESESINQSFGGTPEVGDSVVHNGTIYMYLPYKHGKNYWVEVKARKTYNTSDYAKLKNAIGLK